jgi:RNA-dependent RNA polymerase
LDYISILHLRISDLKGPDCPECIALAEAASHAVDFQKNGTPVSFDTLPRPSGYVMPDFLAHESASVDDTERFYRSNKVLGTLFRNVPTPRRTPATDTSGGFDKIITVLMDLDLSGLNLPPLVTLSRSLMKEMRSPCEYYIERLTAISQTHTLSKSPEARLTEEELVSGTILSNWSDHRKRIDSLTALNFQVCDLVFLFAFA